MSEAQAQRSKRFDKLRERDINKEVFVSELPELGLIVMDSPTVRSLHCVFRTDAS